MKMFIDITIKSTQLPIPIVFVYTAVLMIIQMQQVHRYHPAIQNVRYKMKLGTIRKMQKILWRAIKIW